MMSKQPNKIRTTKYTLETFLPLNLYHQFTKLNNVFFLVTLIMLCIPSVSPFTPYTYLIAFCGILLVSMVKDGIEDFRRSRVDKSVNERGCIKISKNFFEGSKNKYYRTNNIFEDFKDIELQILYLMQDEAIKRYIADSNTNKHIVDQRIDSKEKIGDTYINQDIITSVKNNNDIESGIRENYTSDSNKNRIQTLNNPEDCYKHGYSGSKNGFKESNSNNDAQSYEYSRTNSILYDKSLSGGKYHDKGNTHNVKNAYDHIDEAFNVDSKPFVNSDEIIISKDRKGHSNLIKNEFETNRSYKDDEVKSLKRFREFDAQDRRVKELCIFFENIQNIFTSKGINISPTKVETLEKCDFVIVRENEEIPADLFLIYSITSDLKSKDHCFVETSGLDGETNLKRKTHPRFFQKDSVEFNIDALEDIYNNSSKEIRNGDTQNLNIDKILNMIFFKAINDARLLSIQPLLKEIIFKMYLLLTVKNLKYFETLASGQELNDIQVRIKSGENTHVYSHQQILLKGSVVKQASVLGMVISVGNETKQSKNQRIKELSNSNFEKKINENLKICFVFYFIILTATGILGSTFLTKDLPYLYLNENKGTKALGLISTNYILFSFLVPISLFVTIEISRIFMGIFINEDKKFCISRDSTSSSSRFQNSNSMKQSSNPSIYSIITENRSNNAKNNLYIEENNKYCNTSLQGSIKMHQKKNCNAASVSDDTENKASSNSNQEVKRDISQKKSKNIDNYSVTGFETAYVKNQKNHIISDNTIKKSESHLSNSDIDAKSSSDGKVVLKRHLLIPISKYSNKTPFAFDFHRNKENTNAESFVSEPTEKIFLDESYKHSSECKENTRIEGNRNIDKKMRRFSHHSDRISDIEKNKEVFSVLRSKSEANKQFSEENGHRTSPNNMNDASFESKRNNYNLGNSRNHYSTSSPSTSWLSTPTSQQNEIENSNCICRNSNIVEDLGNVKYILTDKTGTLTCNEMSLVYIGTYHKTYSVKQFNSIVKSFRYNKYFSHIDINKKGYGLENLRSFIDIHKNFGVLNREETFFFICLGLICCNSVEIFNGSYEGQSQDEVCILKGLQEIIRINSRTEKSIIIDFLGNQITIEILMTLDFSSERRRMTIVVQLFNRVFIFSKGGDSAIKSRLDKNYKEHFIDRKYTGYRSLMLSFKEISFNTNEILNNNTENTLYESKLQKTATEFSFASINSDKIADTLKSENNIFKNSNTTQNSQVMEKKSEKINIDNLKKSRDDKKNQGIILKAIENYNSIGLENRDKEVESIFDRFEFDMIFLGTTYVEDKIEDGVGQCIQDLLLAGINIWMITGDKEESAKSCGMQCGLHLSEKFISENKKTNHRFDCQAEDTPITNVSKGIDQNNHTISSKQSEIYKSNTSYRTENIKQDYTQSTNSRISPNNSRKTVRNDERSLRNNEECHKIADRSAKSYMDTVSNSDSKFEKRCFTIAADKAIEKLRRNESFPQTAIIYRASPEQKAEIAKLLHNVVAVGDGNNDIMMIQESDVGIGIRGKEGTQASLSADISAPSFYALRRLILVHGYYNYARVSKVALNSLYKNLLLIFVQFYYNFFNGYSGRPVFNFFFLNYFNVLFTSFIPLYIIIFDKDKEDEELLNNPRNYALAKKYFNKTLIAMNVILAVTKASMLFWLTYFMFRTVDFTDRNGLLGGYGALNNWFSLIVFLTVFFRQIRMINFFNIFSIFVILLSLVLYFFSVFVIQEFSIETKNSAFHIYSMPVFYIALLVVFGMIFFLDFVYDVTHSAIIHHKKK